MQDDVHLAELLEQIAGADRNNPHADLVRQVTRLRARNVCEYCLLPTSRQFQIDHIVPAALWPDYTANRLSTAITPIANRRGPDHLDNFAWCCPFCNEGKRQRITHRVGRHVLRLFDPRHDIWSDHLTFMNHYLFIVGLTPIGVATQRALEFNVGGISGPLGTRHDSILDGHYLPPWIASRTSSTPL